MDHETDISSHIRVIVDLTDENISYQRIGTLVMFNYYSWGPGSGLVLSWEVVSWTVAH